jgi:hypothetical protein
MRGHPLPSMPCELGMAGNHNTGLFNGVVVVF